MTPLGVFWRRCQSAGQSFGSLKASLGSFLGNTTCVARLKPTEERVYEDVHLMSTEYHMSTGCVCVLPAKVCVVGGPAQLVCRPVH